MGRASQPTITGARGEGEGGGGGSGGASARLAPCRPPTHTERGGEPPLVSPMLAPAPRQLRPTPFIQSKCQLPKMIAANRCPRTRTQVPNDSQTLDPLTFSDGPIDDSVFAVPAGCKSRCPFYSVCTVAGLLPPAHMRL